MGSIGVVVAHHDPSVAESVAEILERAPDLFVASTSLAQARPGNVVVAGGEPLATLTTCAHPIVALADGDPVRAARAALAAGAHDILRWPEEGDRLPGAVRRAAEPPADAGAGRLVAVVGARGGLGVSVIAAALAASIDEAIVVDLSPSAGQRMFLEGEPTRTVADLLAAHADPPPEAIEAALVPHAGGARALHGARFLAEPSPIEVHGLLLAARALSPAVVVDAGLAGSALARSTALAADVTCMVVGNDVASVRPALAHASHSHLVIRRVRAGGVPIRDVASALGCDKYVVIPRDAALARAVDLGGLPRQSSAMRRIRALAEALR